jgi:hypothetical protein
MFKHMLNRSARTNLEAGRRILPKLRADARLALPAAVLGAALDELEAAVNTVLAAVAAARETAALRDDGVRRFGTALREFAMVILNAGGNHHRVQPYAIYFPEGYGVLRRLKPAELVQFTGQITTLLEKEADPKPASYRQPLIEASAEFAEVDERSEAAARALEDALAFQKASRHRFVRALAQARHLAAVACDEEPAYIKGIFSPAYTWRTTAPETVGDIGAPGTPDEVESPAALPASAVPEPTPLPWIPIPAVPAERAA